MLLNSTFNQSSCSWFFTKSEHASCVTRTLFPLNWHNFSGNTDQKLCKKAPTRPTWPARSPVPRDRICMDAWNLRVRIQTRLHRVTTKRRFQGNCNADVKQFVTSSCQSVSCCLLPYPGDVVADGEFTGDFEGKKLPSKSESKPDEFQINLDVSSDFMREVRTLTEALFSSVGLRKKAIGGREVTCAEWCRYFEEYVRLLQGKNLPRPASLVKVRLVVPI